MYQARCLLWLLILLTACPCPADEIAPPDFGPGFKQLAALGIPQLPEGTRWIAPKSEQTSIARIDRKLSKRIKGGAWLLPDTGDGKSRTMTIGSIHINDAAPSDEDGKTPSKGLLGRILASDEKKPKAAPEADLAKDVASIRKAVEKLKDFDDADDFRENWNPHGAHSFGPLMIFASQLAQTGHPNLANQLATTLFLKAPNREIVVDAAVNSIGDQLHEKATQDFFKTHDWKTYHIAMKDLVEKFSRGWENQTAVAMMIEPLSVRASGASPRVPKLEKFKFDAHALKSIVWMNEDPALDPTESKLSPEIAAQLARLPAEYHAQYLQQIGHQNDSSMHQVGTWLLKSPNELKESAGPAWDTLQHGIAALPVLAALTDDTYMTARRNNSNQGRSYYSSEMGPYKRAIQAYASMNRPSSRGDLASFLLAATLPNPENDISNTDSASLRDIALEFSERHRNASLAEIAITFLSEGSNKQKKEAAQVLAASKYPADHKALEDHILSDLSPVSQLISVHAYVVLRKTAAKPFYDNYVKTLKEEIGDGNRLEDNRELPWELRDKDRVLLYIKQLDSLTAGKSPQTMAREIAAGTAKEAQTAIPALMRSLSEEKPRHQLFALLSGALAAEDTETRALFINQTFQIGWVPESEDIHEESNRQPDRKYSKNEAKAWRKLIDDDRTLPATRSHYGNGTGNTLGRMAALAFEYSVQSEIYADLREAAVITGRTIGEIASERATARLAGNPIPPLPDPAKASAERLAEIVTAAAGQSPSGLHSFLKKLNYNERAAWLKWIAEPGEITIPESVANARSIIVERLPNYYGMTDTPGTLRINAGIEINTQTVNEAARRSAADIAAHSRSLAIITRTDFAPGLSILATRLELPKEKHDDDDDDSSFGPSIAAADIFRNLIEILEGDNTPENVEGLIMITVSSNPAPSSPRFWWVVDGKLQLFQPGGDDEDEEDPANPATWPAELKESDSPFSIQILVISRTDAKAIVEFKESSTPPQP